MGKNNRTSFGVPKPGGGGKKKVWGSKNVLHSPFSLAFPPALAGSADAVIGILKSEFPRPPMLRITVRKPRAKEAGSDDEGQSSSSSSPAEGEGAEAGKVAPAESIEREDCSMRAADIEGAGNVVLESGARDIADTKQRGVNMRTEVDSSSSARRPHGILVGMNEVTKGLEKGHVALVVAARDASPPILLAHLPALCYMQDAALIAASGNGDDIASVLGVKKLLSFALLRPERVQEGESRQLVQRLVGVLRPHATKLNFPWLSVAKGEQTVPPHLPEPHLAPPNRLL
jgi:ribosomal protein L7Ae-like RNA K-turn-binding protein